MATRATVTAADVAFWDAFGAIPDEAMAADIVSTEARGIAIRAVLPQTDCLRVGHPAPALDVPLFLVDGTPTTLGALAADAAEVGVISLL